MSDEAEKASSMCRLKNVMLIGISRSRCTPKDLYLLKV